MDASLEMMAALMIVLGVITLAIVAVLVWGTLKKRKAKTRRLKQETSHVADERASGYAGPPAQEGEATVSSPIAVPGSAEESSPAAAPEPVVHAAESPPEPDGVLLMQVWQDDDGVLLVEVDGERYRRLYDIRDGAVGRGVLETINRLVAFSKGQESRTTSPMQPATLADAPSSASEPRAEVRSEPFPVQLQAESTTAAPKQRFTMDPVPFRRRKDVLQPGITLDLAAEVDKFLQIRASASPEFGRRYIHVTSSPDGGLRFHVDGARYDALDAIPDGQVQALLRAAIADWEAQR
jgi:hypothetical protein